MAVVKDGVVSTLPSFVSIGVSFFGAAAILVSMDWRFVILLLFGGALGLGLVLLFRNPMKRRHKRMQEAEASLHATTQESLENIRLIKASVSENRTLGQIRKRQEVLRKEQVRQGRFSTVMNNSMGMVFQYLCRQSDLWLPCSYYPADRQDPGTDRQCREPGSPGLWCDLLRGTSAGTD